MGFSSFCDLNSSFKELWEFFFYREITKVQYQLSDRGSAGRIHGALNTPVENHCVFIV